jgi:hypothetical protein
MALGPLTYKTPAQITQIQTDFSGSEGCGVTLTATQGRIELANAASDLPYGIIVVGAGSIDGTYPGAIAAGALEIVDATGCVVQVQAGAGAITLGLPLTVDTNGAFVDGSSVAAGSWVWGYALTAAPAGGQFLARFQPFKVFSLT